MRAIDVTAGSVLREARTRARLTQRELARLAGISQSVIAAYESDAREPSLATLGGTGRGQRVQPDDQPGGRR
jgi:transcriptional regulator with XRE-family HTH domain